MNIKPQPNTAAINSLKQQGYRLTINHFRKKLWKDKKEPLIADKAVRENQKMGGFGYEMVSQNGGATELHLLKGEQQIAIRVDCYAGDSFAKKIGVRVALDKLKTLFDLPPP